MDKIQVAAGSITGRNHLGRGNLLLGGNNQDAFTIYREPDLLIAVVADGCGSSEKSEVGAALGVQSYTSALLKEWRGGDSDTLHTDAFWQRVDARALAPIAVVAESLTTPAFSFKQVLNHHFLFTILGVIHTPAGTWIFRSGGSDGVIDANGEVVELLPGEGNCPGYPAYQLLQTKFSADPKFSRLTVERFIPSGEMQSILIGTDGVLELLRRADDLIPGTTRSVGTLGDLWGDDRIFTDPSALQRRLRAVNSEVVTLNRHTQPATIVRSRGLLSDDTTLVLIRRR